MSTRMRCQKPGYDGDHDTASWFRWFPSNRIVDCPLATRQQKKPSGWHCGKQSAQKTFSPKFCPGAKDEGEGQKAQRSCPDLPPPTHDQHHDGLYQAHLPRDPAQGGLRSLVREDCRQGPISTTASEDDDNSPPPPPPPPPPRRQRRRRRQRRPWPRPEQLLLSPRQVDEEASGKQLNAAPFYQATPPPIVVEARNSAAASATAKPPRRW